MVGFIHLLYDRVRRPFSLITSLFLHRNTIQYTTTRDIDSGEEMSISHETKSLFNPAGTEAKVPATSEADDRRGGLTAVDDENAEATVNPYTKGDQNEVILEEDLPFIRFKLPPEEEDAQSIRTSTPRP